MFDQLPWASLSMSRPQSFQAQTTKMVSRKNKVIFPLGSHHPGLHHHPCTCHSGSQKHPEELWRPGGWSPPCWFSKPHRAGPLSCSQVPKEPWPDMSVQCFWLWKSPLCMTCLMLVSSCSPLKPKFSGWGCGFLVGYCLTYMKPWVLFQSCRTQGWWWMPESCWHWEDLKYRLEA